MRRAALERHPDSVLRTDPVRVVVIFAGWTTSAVSAKQVGVT